MNRPEFLDEKLPPPLPQRSPVLLSVSEVLTLLRRQMRAIALVTVIFALIGGAYVVTARKLYTGEATLLVDPRRVQLFRQDSVTSDLSFDSATLESQIETLKSDNVAMAVINNLELWKDAEFIGEPPGPIDQVIARVREFFDPSSPDTDENKKRRALDAFRAKLDVKRSGLSYAIQVKFTSWTAQKASTITNEVGEAYILDQIESRYELTQRASIWLQSRIKELQGKASEAERAVADFRFSNQIVDANGRLVTEQQLEELSRQLSQARLATADAKAKLDRLREIIRNGTDDATVAEVLRNEVYIKLRSDYLEVARREADWSARFGANHQQSVQLRGDLMRLQRSMQDELKRTEQTFQSDYEISRSREEAAQKDMALLMIKWGETRQAQLQLRDLDSTAASFRTLHDNFVQRYLQAIQQQSFPISDARVISPASPPRRASAPRGLLLGLASLVVGLGAGVAFALFRELGDERVRTARDLEADTGIDCIGPLPIEDRKAASKAASRAGAVTPPPPDESVPHFSMPSSQPALSQSIRQPFSLFGETCRNVKVAIDVARMVRPAKVVGIVSSQAGEGKTTASVNIGLTLARSGSRVLVIDADLRKPRLTQTLMPDAKGGLVEVLLGQRDLHAALWREASTGCYFLPAVLTVKLSNTADLLASPAMQELLRKVSAEFDYVILDCTPINPVSDVRASAHLIDAFIMIAAWGETKRDTVNRAMNADYIRGKLVGSLLTKVNLNSYKLFEHYDDSYYSYDYVRN